VFGLSFGELVVLIIVAMVVLGPKELPRYLRKAGQFAGRLRHLASEMREKSGIDEVLRSEGIHQDIAEIRKLARGEIGGVMSAVRSANDAVRSLGAAPPIPYAPPPAQEPGPLESGSPLVVSRDREYPREGADSYGALPDTAVMYAGPLPESPLATDTQYARGEPSVSSTTASSASASSRTG
jgi:sec-independent protein translocase protein TatB